MRIVLVFGLLAVYAASGVAGDANSTTEGVAEEEAVFPMEPLQEDYNQDGALNNTGIRDGKSRLERQQRKEEKRQRAEQRRTERGQLRRERGERRRNRYQNSRGRDPTNASSPQQAPVWLQRIMAAMWDAINILRHEHRQIFKHLKNSLTAVSVDNTSTTTAHVTTTTTNAATTASNTSNWCEPMYYGEEECAEFNQMCEESTNSCSDHGKCCCGECLCDEPFNGAACDCDDTFCVRYNGLLCGGQGECRCGHCQCNDGYTGDACECSTDTRSCRDGIGNGPLCSGQGRCTCGKCICNEGSWATGRYCEEGPFKAGMCAQLKPCVLCLALDRVMPQCRRCGHVTVSRVAELQSSHLLCRMVHSGCLLEYAYQAQGGGRYDVMVPQDLTC